MQLSAYSQPVAAGIVTAIVGFSSSFAVVLAGVRAVGAGEAQAASALLVLSVTMGLAAIGLGLRYRMPISIAWSTPGAALLVSTGSLDDGFAAAVGGFAICGALLFLTGVVPALRAAVTAIPSALANALLAGALVTLCLSPVDAVVDDPAAAVPVVLAWALLTRFARKWAVPGALATALVVIAISHDGALRADALAPQLAVVAPHVDLQGITLGVGLYIVTMASQNIPGVAVLSTFGYRAPLRPALIVTGAGTALGSLFGGHAINLAAISAALCAGPDADPDPDRRWIASVTAGIAYIVLGCGAGLVTSIAGIAPPGLIEAVAGLALLGTLGAALAGALADPTQRDGAVATFVVMVSGVSVLGIGSACWALVAGLALLVILRRRPVAPATSP
ncbi:MAG: benzoate transport protein [Pseudonocardiales bacterium]|nr:benzoate transport protein [Pseudonocardiales bacterium]